MQTFDTELVCEFFVPGEPEPAGSKQSFVPLNKKAAHPEVDQLINKLLARGGLSIDERKQLEMLKRFSKTYWPRGIPFQDEHGRVVVNTVDANKNAGPWKEVVATVARFSWGANRGLIDGPIAVEFTFYMPRPKNHYGTGRNANRLKDSAPTVHTVKPDGLKLSRAIEDALTGLVWSDDARIVDEYFQKLYTDDIHPKPGVSVRVFTLQFQTVKTNEQLSLELN